MSAPWNAEGWMAASERELDDALASVNRPRTGPIEQFKTWGRSCIRIAPTANGPVWIKHGYALPPGEDVVLSRLITRWSDRLPQLVTTWPGAVATDALPGVELSESHPPEAWIRVSRQLGEIMAGERTHVPEWISLGVRDRRPHAWEGTLERLLASEVLDALSPETRHRLDEITPELMTRYGELFGDAATLVPQDSGCCNIHIDGSRVVFYDWADVIIGHPFFSCDRLLDQAPRETHEEVVKACSDALGLRLSEFKAIRRFNVLHEAIRYHDELAYLDPDDPIYTNLANSARSQVDVAVTHWRSD